MITASGETRNIQVTAKTVAKGVIFLISTLMLRLLSDVKF